MEGGFEGGRECGCCGGLVQLDLWISTFDDFHNSELGGRIALGSINADATRLTLIIMRGNTFSRWKGKCL